MINEEFRTAISDPHFENVDSCDNTTKNEKPPATKAGITKQNWGELAGKKVYLFTLTNNKGTEVTITNYGGTVTSFVTADKHRKRSRIILGFDSLGQYLQNPPYFGALIGRYGNRIGDAKFTLDGTTYQLAANDGKNHLHGGVKGFDKVLWDASVQSQKGCKGKWFADFVCACQQ